jgi:hypothetical protein
MRGKTKYLWCIIAILVAGNIAQLIWNNGRLFVDAVPNEETALIIAEAILISAYGGDVLFTKPFCATYDKFRKAWIVTGKLPEPPEGQFINGGVPEIVIRKRDGKIMKIYHGM